MNTAISVTDLAADLGVTVEQLDSDLTSGIVNFADLISEYRYNDTHGVRLLENIAVTADGAEQARAFYAGRVECI